MSVSFLAYTSNSYKIRCWIYTNWNLQLLITLVLPQTSICLPSSIPSLCLPRRRVTGIRCCVWKQELHKLLWDMLVIERSLHFHICAHFKFTAFAGYCAKQGTTCVSCRISKLAKVSLLFILPHRTIRMETFALLEGSDKDGFLKFPFLSENERKMLF